MQESKKKESWFQSCRKEVERWEIEQKQGKTWEQFKKELEERNAEGDRGVVLSNEIKNRFPRAYEFYTVISDGSTNLFSDAKDVIVLHYNVWRGKRAITDFNLRELELLYEIFNQLKRMLPVFSIVILPFGGLAVLIVAYMKPLAILSPHFWTVEQKAFVIKQEHEKKVAVFLPIIQYLEINLPEENNSKLVSKFRDFLASVQDGLVPNSTELAAFRELFADEKIFVLEKVSPSHVDNLMTLHGQKGLFLKIDWLGEWVSYLHLVDRDIKRGGGVTKLSPEQLKKYCFQRGVNANAMTEEEMHDYLIQWMAFSENISSDYSSLLLHAPAIIGFNHKSNHSVTDDSLL